MFTAEQRASLRADVLSRADDDRRLSGVAVTGSGAAGHEDEWSDIDIAFGVADEAELPAVLADRTAYMYGRHGALHHVDVRSGPWIYRVFLLGSALQVDLAFVRANEFRALAPSFRLIHGEAEEPRHIPPPQAADLIGLAWLYALHARSSIARQRFWQAEYMISGMRDHAMALACLRHGVPTSHGRGMDLLPPEAVAQFADTLVRHLDKVELWRALRTVTVAVVAEIAAVEASLARRLEETLMQLAAPV